MKPIADWIREQTPGWTDDARYTLVSRIHSWGPPVCLLLFVFTDNPAIRFLTLCLVLTTLLSELDASGLSRHDGRTRVLGLDLGRSLSMGHSPDRLGIDAPRKDGAEHWLEFWVSDLDCASCFLRESVLWMVGITGLAVSAIPALGLLSRVHPPLEIVEQLGRQIPSLPVSP
jgi:hypothetical protein